MRSTIQSKKLTPSNNVLNLENSVYVCFQNLGPNDCEIQTSSGGNILLPTSGPQVQVYASDEKPFQETIQANFPFGNSVIQVVYSYMGKTKC